MFIGLDIGTTAIKAILIDAEQRILASASADHATRRPQAGWSEQAPDDWITGTRATLAELRRQAPSSFAAVEAIGLSGQMHSGVLLGADHRPLQPAILWNDARGYAECSELADALPEIDQVTGVHPMPGFTAAKVMWVRKNRPDVFRRIAHLLLPKDYVRLWLTGTVGSDVSDAAGTQLLDQAARAWWPAAIAAVGLPLEAMPRLFESTTAAGTVRPLLAAQMGFDRRVVVAAGGGDAGAGALGIGCVGPGEGLISLGTSALFVVTADRYAPRPETMLHNFAHCIPGRWYQMAGMLNGASALRWVLNLLQVASVESALADVARQYRGRPSTVTFLPYLDGERTPHNNPDARGAFVGLSSGTTAVDLIQAVLEGVAFSLCDARACLAIAEATCPDPFFIGGGARVRLWGQIIANATGLSLSWCRDAALGSALGAARLAMIAAGRASIETACRKPVGAEAVRPDPSTAAAYRDRYSAYRELYRSTKKIAHL